ncbi:MAG: alpha-amylase [Anaerolineaceae bacterium]|nr:alpha-amylase [Anaerolineaceae bacterium]
MNNETLMQYFEWYLPNDGLWWKRCAAKAQNLAALGVTQVWLPPAYKGTSQEDVGYGVYDMYDLGEFDQKGTVRTKYGTKSEYIEAIQAFHMAGIRVMADIVLNHRLGGDEFEKVTVVTDNPENRNEQIGEEQKIRTRSRFTFPGRKGKYSSFIWDHSCFTGTDWDEKTKSNHQLYRFAGKQWAEQTDSEHGNYDYLLGMDVDMSNPVVVRETKRWLRWYIKTTGIDGFRLDAVKHISFPFYRELLKDIRKKSGLELPAVGEYWSGDLSKLLNYLDTVDNEMSLFDVPLHYNFFNASQSGADFDLRTIFDNTLIRERPQNAVTFADNHDTQIGQSLQSFIAEWFKPHCYALILLRKEGLPCVFYSDYYGNPVKDLPPVLNLGKMMKLRRFYAYGEQEDYFDDPHLVGWVRRGDAEHDVSGLAVTLSNGDAGIKKMCMGKDFAGMTFADVLGNCTEPVTIDKRGWGKFGCEAGRVSVWVRPEAFEKLVISD